MTTLDKNSDTKRKFSLSLPLFWRLFLSLLLMLLLTSVISVAIERAINAQALESRMAMQVAHLVTVRQDVIEKLEAGNFKGVRQIYRHERGLRNQIIILDEQGVPLYSRFKPWVDRDNRSPRALNTPAALPNQMIQEVVPNEDNYPELKDISITALNGNAFTVQLQPRLPLQELIALQKTHFSVRFGIILLFSLLACYWLSRALSKRIRQVQLAVHRMSAGDYREDQASHDLLKLGDDELGALAKDVSYLSNRLAESELSRKQMLSDISHELRSPLARLEVATELTRDYAPEATHYLDRIQKESMRMNGLIGQIINIQSLQMQRYATHDKDYETVDIARLLNEIGQDVCFEFQDKHIEWQCVGIGDDSSGALMWSIKGNREQLHSAFENVIRNAFVYSNSNALVAAEIESIRQYNQTSNLKISLIDQGSGINNADLSRIFQPFVRLDASRQRPVVTTANSEWSSSQSSKREGGYGLGLAIAQAIIAAHKGQISARNRDGSDQGLVIEIILPIEL